MKSIIKNISKIANYFDKHHQVKEANFVDKINANLVLSYRSTTKWTKIASIGTQDKLTVKHAEDVISAFLSLEKLSSTIKDSKDLKLAWAYSSALYGLLKYAKKENLLPIVKTSGERWDKVKDTMMGVGRGLKDSLLSPLNKPIRREKYLRNIKRVEKMELAGQGVAQEMHSNQDDPQKIQELFQNFVGSLNESLQFFAREASVSSYDQDQFNFLLSHGVVETIQEIQSLGRTAQTPDDLFNIVIDGIKQLQNTRMQQGYAAAQQERGGMPQGQRPQGQGQGPQGQTPIGGYGQQQQRPLNPQDAYGKRTFYVTRQRAASFLQKYGGQGKEILQILTVPEDWAQYTEENQSQKYPKDLPPAQHHAANEAFRDGIARLINRYGNNAEAILDHLGIPIRHKSWPNAARAGMGGNRNTGRGTGDPYDLGNQGLFSQQGSEEVNKSLYDMRNTGTGY
jgi:hypothetical protein